jgi:hypothetical protein
MRPNNRQRSRGGRNGGGGGGGGGGHHHKQHHQQHNHNPNRPPNRNQIFDSSGPDVRVRGNAHQVFDKYQALAREAASLGDRILSEAYWQYAEHYYRIIQSQGGFVPRNNWGEGEEGQQQQNPQQQGHQNGPNGQQVGPNGQQGGPNGQQGGPQNIGGGNNNGHQQNERNGGPPPQIETQEAEEPGLGGVAFLQSGRGTQQSRDPSADDQPEVPEFPTTGRR